MRRGTYQKYMLANKHSNIVKDKHNKDLLVRYQYLVEMKWRGKVQTLGGKELIRKALARLLSPQLPLGI